MKNHCKASIKNLSEISGAFDKHFSSLLSNLPDNALSSQLINDLKISFTEGLANAAKHALELEKKGEIEFDIKLKSKFVQIEISDHGTGFDLKKIDTPSFKEMNESGRGIFIMRQLMDEVVYIKGLSKNKLVLKRYLPFFSRKDEGLDLLHELSHTVVSPGEESEKNIYSLVLKKLVEAFEVGRASVMLYDHSKKRLTIKAAVGLAKQVHEDVSLRPGEGIAGFVFQHAKSCVVSNIDKNKDGWEKKTGYKSLSLMCAPFFDPESPTKPLGVINVTERKNKKSFGKKDLRLLTTIANQLTAYLYVSRLKETLERADTMKREFQIAREIQQSLLPKTPMQLKELEIHAWLENAASVGGDLYDIIYKDKQHLYVVVADVSGHNVAAAMNLVNCRGHLRALLEVEREPARVLSKLNKLIYEDLSKSHQFISIILMRFNLKNLTVKVASAGHDAPWIFERKKVYSLDTKIPSGTLMGLELDTTYQSALIRLKRGNLLLLYTDGLPECRNSKGDIFSRKKFYSYLQTLRPQKAYDLIDSMQTLIAQFKKQAPFRDDVTAVSIHCL